MCENCQRYIIKSIGKSITHINTFKFPVSKSIKYNVTDVFLRKQIVFGFMYS